MYVRTTGRRTISGTSLLSLPSSGSLPSGSALLHPARRRGSNADFLGPICCSLSSLSLHARALDVTETPPQTNSVAGASVDDTNTLVFRPAHHEEADIWVGQPHDGLAGDASLCLTGRQQLPGRKRQYTTGLSKAQGLGKCQCRDGEWEEEAPKGQPCLRLLSAVAHDMRSRASLRTMREARHWSSMP